MAHIWLNAAQKGDLRRLKLCIKGCPFFDINSTTNLGQSALMLAIPTKNMKLIYYLLKHNINIHISDKIGENALSLALRFKNERLSEILYEKGCRITKNLIKPLGNHQEKLKQRLDNWKTAKYLVRAYLTHKVNLI